MRSLMVLGAAASMLVLAGCNRETETAPAADDAAMSADASSATDAGSDAAASASDGNEGGGASAAGSMSETMDPSGSASAAPGEIVPPTDATRANAQQAAEETNLHPKPSGQR